VKPVGSAGTNRIDKLLLAANAGWSRSDALLIERNMPFGMRPGGAERMSTRR
jgi:hypothetical protein